MLVCPKLISESLRPNVGLCGLSLIDEAELWLSSLDCDHRDEIPESDTSASEDWRLRAGRSVLIERGADVGAALIVQLVCPFP